MSNYDRRWWLNISGQVDGPRGSAYILAGLQAGRFHADLPACLEGTNQWRPLSDWPEFANVSSISRTVAPSNTFVGSPGNFPPAPPQSLPPMANAIVLYSTIVLPGYLVIRQGLALLSGLSAPVSDRDEAFGMLIGTCLGLICSAVVGVFMFIGGLRLRDRRACSLWLLKFGIWFDLVLAGLFCCLASSLLAVSGQVDENTGMHGTEILHMVYLIFVGGPLLIFEIIALIWLSNHGPSLPLKPNE